jgi:hypothetical protein
VIVVVSVFGVVDVAVVAAAAVGGRLGWWQRWRGSSRRGLQDRLRVTTLEVVDSRREHEEDDVDDEHDALELGKRKRRRKGRRRAG